VPILLETEPSNKSMSDTGINLVRVKREHGLHRAAQLLADASRIRRGESPRPLIHLAPAEREWCKQTARQLIEVFETITTDRETDAVQAQRVAQEVRLSLAVESRLAIERSRARMAASERGHDLGSWRPTHPDVPGEERADCRRCDRYVRIAIGNDPVLSGSALTEGCIVAATDGEARS
jgi:hypothetical protein